MKSKVLHVEYCADTVWFPLRSKKDRFLGLYVHKEYGSIEVEDWPIDDSSVQMNFPIRNILEGVFK